MPTNIADRMEGTEWSMDVHYIRVDKAARSLTCTEIPELNGLYWYDDSEHVADMPHWAERQW